MPGTDAISATAAIWFDGAASAGVSEGGVTSMEEGGNGVGDSAGKSDISAMRFDADVALGRIISATTVFDALRFTLGSGAQPLSGEPKGDSEAPTEREALSEGDASDTGGDGGRGGDIRVPEPCGALRAGTPPATPLSNCSMGNK